METINEEEKIWTTNQLEKIRDKAKAECWKKRNSVCNLGSAEMYEHDGGVLNGRRS